VGKSGRRNFAIRYTIGHFIISVLLAAACAGIVFGFWYRPPYAELLKVTRIFLLILGVNVLCGPLLTFVVSNPTKSRRERVLDLSVIALVQSVALAYGMHTLWLARPVVLAFERDRLVVVTSSEIDHARLPMAPEGLRHLPTIGVVRVGTRRATSSTEMFDSVQQGLSGISPAMQPAWWVPWATNLREIKAYAKPLEKLIARHPDAAATLLQAATDSSHKVSDLTYLPLTSQKNKEWVALLDKDANIVGYAAVDGF